MTLNIKKINVRPFQEQIRKRKEEEDRIAAQNEFLNRSLRGSRKLQALESRPQGTVNDAFAEDEGQESSRTVTPAPAAEKELVHIAYGKCLIHPAAQNTL